MKRIELIGHRGNILSLSWNLTGSHLASGSSDGTIRLWSKDRIDDAFSNVPSPRDINTSTQNPRALTLPTVKSSTEIRPLKSVSKSIDQICWSPCEANVFAFISSTDRSLCVWDSQRIDAEYSGSYVFIGEESSSAHHCLSLCWSPDGAFLCVATKNSTIYFVSVMREDSPFNISLRVVHATKFKEPINQVKWISLDTIYVTTTVGTVEILKREDESAPLMTLMTSSLEDCEEIVRKELDFKPWKLCRGHSASCYTVAMDKEMRRFATGGGDATVALWDVKTLSCYCSVIHYK